MHWRLLRGGGHDGLVVRRVRRRGEGVRAHVAWSGLFGARVSFSHDGWNRLGEVFANQVASEAWPCSEKLASMALQNVGMAG